jgi:flavin-dependent dehydrogenase
VYSVLISGAGPAGVAAAVALVQEGLAPERILCLDRARFPRPKPCGGGLTGHADAALEALGLAVRVPSVSCPEGRLVYRRLHRTVTMRRPVRIVRRDELDADLVAQARDRGIEVREGEGLARFAASSGGVEVETTAGRRLSAQVLVGADGAGSLVRRHLAAAGGFERRPLRLSRLELEQPARLPATMVYDYTPFASGLRGYVWIFPVPGGRINVGIMHEPAGSGAELGGRALEAVLAETLANHGISLPGPARGWPAWGYHPNAPVAGPRLLCAGDAAGIDGLTGEGIAVGLAHGPVVARAVRMALSTRDFGFDGYRQALRRCTEGRELALDRWLAGLLYRMPDFRASLSLVMFDDEVRALYAARVSGDLVLADHKAVLVKALARHLYLGRQRMAALESTVDSRWSTARS